APDVAAPATRAPPRVLLWQSANIADLWCRYATGPPATRRTAGSVPARPAFAVPARLPVEQISGDGPALADGHGNLIRICGPDFRSGFHRDGVGPSALAQGLAKVEVIARSRIRDHRPPWQIPVQGLIDQPQGQFILALVLEGFRNLSGGPALRVGQPDGGQIEPPQQRATHLGPAPVQTDGHLTIGHFAQRAAVLAGHANRGGARFGKGGFS